MIQLIYFKGKSTTTTTKANLRRKSHYMFALKIRTVYNIIVRAEKEGRLDLKGSTGKKGDAAS